MKPYYETDLGKLYHGDCLEIMPLIFKKTQCRHRDRRSSGDHLLYCGKCGEFAPHKPNVDESVDLVLTDPPYGMNNNPDSTRFSGGSTASKARRGGGKKQNPIIGDNKIFDPKPLLDFPEVILWGYTHFANSLPTGSNLIWLKRLDSAFSSFLSDAEIAWKKNGCGVYCFRDLTMMAAAKTRQHPNQKPIPLMQWCIEKSNTNGVVLDPYLGSGTTAVACERLNRKWIGIEIEERYCRIAVKRIENERKQLKWC